MIPVIEKNMEKIRSLCRQYQVKSLYLIGSAARGGESFTDKSDVDFLLKYKKYKDGLPIKGFDYFELLFSLEGLIKKKVDLVVEESITNDVFRESIEKNKLKVYEA